MNKRFRVAVVSAAVAIAGGLVGVGVHVSNASATVAAGELVATADIGKAAAPAEATFYPDGDRLVVCDTAADGYGAYAQLYWYGYTGRTNRADGAGDCSTATGNIGENDPVRVRACLIKAGVVSNCGPWVNGNA